MNWYFSSCSYNDKSIQSNNCHQYLRIRNLHCKKIAEEGHGQNTLDDKRWGDKSLHVYWRIFVKIFDFATAFCCCNKWQNQICKNLSDLLQHKIMLQRPRFAQKFSSRHKAICCCDIMCNLLQQLNARPLHRVICRHVMLPRALRPLARTSEKCGLVYELVSSTEEQWPTRSL